VNAGRPIRDLSVYTTGDFDRGAPRWKEACWVLCKALFFMAPIPWPSGFRVLLLRLFGARIGAGVVIRSGVNVTFPWKLAVGDHTWIGESAWLLNLAPIAVESHVCISQRAFLCTGSHEHRKPTFDLITRPITLRHGCWVAAQAVVCPGVEIGPGAVLGAGSVAAEDIPERRVARGNPAAVVPLTQPAARRDEAGAAGGAVKESNSEADGATTDPGTRG
jgi:putative colanic acid biosynthesis acetyltransferase WcaF